MWTLLSANLGSGFELTLTVGLGQSYSYLDLCFLTHELGLELYWACVVPVHREVSMGAALAVFLPPCSQSS